MNRDDKTQGNRIREQTGQEYLDLLPGAMDALKDIIGNPETNPAARVQAIGLLMDRGLGKPEETIRIRHMEDNMEQAQARMEEIFALVREKKDGEPGRTALKSCQENRPPDNFTLKKIYTHKKGRGRC